MPGVPAILLDHVAKEPTQAGRASVEEGHVDKPIEPAVGQGRGEPGPRALDGTVPQCVELLRCFVGDERELPALPTVPTGCVPRRPDRLPGQLDGEDGVLDRGKMLEESAEGERGRTDASS